MVVEYNMQLSMIVDVFEKILDKGVVIVGDIIVGIVDVELLMIKICLIVVLVDKVKEIGMDWWENDFYFSLKGVNNKVFEEENKMLYEWLKMFEEKIEMKC